jgi:hypothetical protein
MQHAAIGPERKEKRAWLQTKGPAIPVAAGDATNFEPCYVSTQ